MLGSVCVLVKWVGSIHRVRNSGCIDSGLERRLRYRVCIDQHFAVTSYADKIGFPGEKSWLLWENWLLKVADLSLLACLGFQMPGSTRNKIITVLDPHGVHNQLRIYLFLF